MISTDEVGLALSGFDPVAYFSKGVAVQGKPQYFMLWNGALWLFASADNRDRFVASPAAYAPVFGGYCAYCMSIGHKVSGSPNAWVIYENKLYVHSTENLMNAWRGQPDKFIREATDHWQEISSEAISPAASTVISDQLKALLKEKG
jgi:hypothetical protein